MPDTTKGRNAGLLRSSGATPELGAVTNISESGLARTPHTMRSFRIELAGYSRRFRARTCRLIPVTPTRYRTMSVLNP